MQAAWEGAAAVLDVDGLADVLGERHRIMSNDWLAAHMQSLIGRMLARTAEMLEHIDFTPAALRADLAGARVTPRRVHSVAEVMSEVMSRRPTCAASPPGWCTTTNGAGGFSGNG
jgi:hypothetical protein